VSQLSDADGYLLLRGLPSPPYRLAVELSGYLSLRGERVRQAEREVRVTLVRAAQLRGLVIDALGRPVSGARVGSDEGGARATTDARGEFMLSQLAPGTQSLWASHPALGEATSAVVRARAGESLDDLRIVLPGRLAGDDERGDRTGPGGGRGVRHAETAAPSKSKLRAPTLEQRANGVVVTAPGAAGASAGLLAGDVVLAVDDEEVLSAAHARGMLRDPPGTTARVRVARGGSRLVVRYRRPAL
jgi:S1-C subfamily serine protease